MAHIDYFFVTLSPYVYFAGQRLEGIAEKHAATITYKPLDLLTLFSRTGGVHPLERHEARKAYRLQELRRWSRKLDLSINLSPAFWPTNPAPSCYAVIAAQKSHGTTGAGDLGALVHGFTRAVWAEDRDVAQSEVIRDILQAAGFDPALADADMLACAEEYAANLEEAVSRGVFGAPFYIVDEECFWGQDRLEDLDLYLRNQGG